MKGMCGGDTCGGREVVPRSSEISRFIREINGGSGIRDQGDQGTGNKGSRDQGIRDQGGRVPKGVPRIGTREEGKQGHRPGDRPKGREVVPRDFCYTPSHGAGWPGARGRPPRTSSRCPYSEHSDCRPVPALISPHHTIGMVSFLHGGEVRGPSTRRSAGR